MTHLGMYRFYNCHTAAEGYIVGIKVNHELYAVAMDHIPFAMTRMTKTSSKRGGVPKIKIYFDAPTCKELVASGKAWHIGHESILIDSKYNKGEVFERIITETMTTETWVKDSVPFWVQGDVVINGKQIQVKLNGAEMVTEKAINRIKAMVA